jgi:hypothetical protein
MSPRMIVWLLMLAGGIPAMTGSVSGQSDIVRTIQQKLADAGFDPGTPDGLMGPRTRQALRQFQAARSLAASGYVDEPTQRALGVEVPEVVVPAGTRISVRLGTRLDSGTARAGDSFTMRVDRMVSMGSEGGIPRGAVISGVVREAESAERPQKGGRLALEATGIRSGSFASPLSGHVTAEGESLEGEGSLKEDLKKIGIGAGAGAAIGAILGGKRGALAGVLIGGGGVFLGTKGEQVRLDRETPLLVELTRDLTLPAVQ